MTQKTIATDSNGNQIKTPGWFSWRHKTREAHDAAREAYLIQHGPAARQGKAEARAGAEVRRFKCGHRSASADHPCAVIAEVSA